MMMMGESREGEKGEVGMVNNRAEDQKPMRQDAFRAQILPCDNKQRIFCH